MSDLFVNTYKKRPVIIEKGEGSFVIDESGKKYLDFLSGISVNNWGYHNSGIHKCIVDQLNKIIHPSNYYYTQPQLELAKKLISASGINKVFFANSGTEANEAVLLFLSKYADKQPAKNEIIIFDGAFLGRTHGSRSAASCNNIDNVRFIKVAFNDLLAFKKAVTNKTLAVHLELVLGHGGIKKFDYSVIKEVCDICEDQNILIFIDEVQTGLGRAGNIFLFQEFKIQPDAVTLGKSLGGGLPLSAALVSNRIAENILPGDYGCTMGGNSLACAAGLKIMDYLSKPKTIRSIKNKGEYLLNGLLKLKKKHSQIIDIRCFGLMCGCELREEIASNIVLNTLNLGLLIDIVNKNTLRMLPPFTVSLEEIDMAISILNRSLNKLKL